MGKKFSELRKKMSRKARKQAEKRSKEMLDELPIRKLRKELDLDQEQMAQLLHIQQPAVSKQETRSNVQIETLKKYAEAVGGKLEINVRFPNRRIRLV